MESKVEGREGWEHKEKGREPEGDGRWKGKESGYGYEKGRGQR